MIQKKSHISNLNSNLINFSSRIYIISLKISSIILFLAFTLPITFGLIIGEISIKEKLGIVILNYSLSILLLLFVTISMRMKFLYFQKDDQTFLVGIKNLVKVSKLRLKFLLPGNIPILFFSYRINKVNMKGVTVLHFFKKRKEYEYLLQLSKKQNWFNPAPPTQSNLCGNPAALRASESTPAIRGLRLSHEEAIEDAIHLPGGRFGRNWFTVVSAFLT